MNFRQVAVIIEQIQVLLAATGKGQSYINDQMAYIWEAGCDTYEDKYNEFRHSPNAEVLASEAKQQYYQTQLNRLLDEQASLTAANN